MSIFDSVGQQPNMQQPNMQQLLNQFRSNPAAVLQQKNINIPQGMNDPSQIAQYLCQTGQMQPQRFQHFLKMLGRR